MKPSQEELERRARAALAEAADAMHDPAWRPVAVAAPIRRRWTAPVLAVAVAAAVLALVLALTLPREEEDGSLVTSPGDATTSTVEPALAGTSPTSIETTTSAATVPTTVATTLPPTSVTTRPRPATTTSLPPTTATSTPGPVARVTIVNSYPGTVDVTINGTKHRLTENQRKGPIGVRPAANGNDTIEIVRADNPTCGTGNAQGYFQDLGEHTVTVEARTPSGCSKGEPGPGGRVDPGGYNV